MNVAFSEPHRELVRRLVEARIAAGLSQRQLAERLGVDHSWIGKFESERVRLNVIQFLKLADALNIDAGRLLVGLGELSKIPMVATRVGEPKSAE
ncbi:MULTISPECIES: helix-turn-helix domain-containing protein [Brevundimonas]|jgi:transcriptional regulator with XRE-family HTH domain|uniref:Helix-turn-helix domain-containing protein n=2 Tax=Brevundimonas TaxID=41275 RepID=A0A1Z3UC45_BREVE|nr:MULTISPECIES: helix-turn-helix transcriptional regulator [Brevundimonas]ASE40815.1 XRE family transcriptional regulator [Brevundimonas vesicularis]MDX2335721.1 helix-turn-helix domain-containing protein [Brevundimonas vesicularis]QIF81703.1 helix-turn-helix transcriptional regulator [Brevundimonas sp. 'scallop']QSF53359.1 helix-turn-helix transcriptional regulator [Brevundimonas fontaquae]